MPVKILILGTNPLGTHRLYLGEEVQEISRSLNQSPKRSHFQIEQEWALTMEELSQALLRHRPTIVHFCGHGDENGSVMLADSSGRVRSLPSDTLAEIFGLSVRDGLRCVVLNSCYSAQQGPAIASMVDFVVGTSGKIPDKAARAFSSGFYAGLGAGKSLPDAFQYGVLQIQLLGIQGAELLQQHMREGMASSGLLLLNGDTPVLSETLSSDGGVPDLASRSTGEIVSELEDRLNQRLRAPYDEMRTHVLTEEIDLRVKEILLRGRTHVDSVIAGAKLLKVIGRGNFGTVWLAKREDSGKLCAAKVFHLENLTQGVMLWRFRRSINAMERLSKDRRLPRSIIRLQDRDTSTLAFTMDYHSGGHLEDVARRGWTLDQKIKVFSEICYAV